MKMFSHAEQKLLLFAKQMSAGFTDNIKVNCKFRQIIYRTDGMGWDGTGRDGLGRYIAASLRTPVVTVAFGNPDVHEIECDA